MKYIKDTDFLPDVKSVSRDVYRLTYGVVKIRVEYKIYDMLVYMCRAYPDTPLRKAKINAWISAVNNVIDKIKVFLDEDEYRAYIPYMGLFCTADNLINLYSFTIQVLNELYTLEKIPEYRKGTTKEVIQHFFPIENLDILMKDFAEKCEESGEYDNEIRIIVDKELERRGIIASSTAAASKTYDELFYGADKLPQFELLQNTEEEEQHPDNDTNWFVGTGFIYFALKHYLTIAYERKQTKDHIFGTLLNSATYRIASGIFKPNDDIKRQRTTDNTFYQYVDKTFKKNKEDRSGYEKAKQRFEAFIK